MPDPTFETRLASQLHAYAQGGVRPIDRIAVAEATIAAARTRGIAARISALMPTPGPTVRLLVALLLLLALAIALLVAAQQRLSLIPPGRLAYIQDGNVFVADSDASGAVMVLDDPVVDFERVTALPDPDHLAVEANGILAILDLTTGERRRIAQTNAHVTWDDHGRFAFPGSDSDRRPVIVVGDPAALGAAPALRELTPAGPVSDVLAVSPDGLWLATIMEGTIYRIDASTGSTTAIGELGQDEISVSERGLAWSPDSRQLVIATQGYGACEVGGGCTPGDQGLMMLDVISGRLRQLTGPEPGDASLVNGYRYLGADMLPRWSPDGQWIAFRGSPGLSIVRPDGTGRRDLVSRPVGWFAWTPDSSGLEFVANEGLDDASGELSWVSLADDVPRSLGRASVSGLAVGSVIPDEGATHRFAEAGTVAPGPESRIGSVVPATPGGGPADPSAWWQGLLFTTASEGCQSVARIDFDDPTVRPSDPDGCFQKVRLSPDGRRVATGGPARQPDGSFASTPEGRVAIADLTTGVTTVVRPGDERADEGLGPTIGLLKWSPGGRWLAWDIGRETWILSADGATSRRLESGGWPEWSPDDAYVALETRAEELVVGTGGGTDLHVVGPSETIWGWSGGGDRYAFIRDGDAWLANADGSDLRDLTDFEFGGATGLALSPDGERLAVVQQARVLWLIDGDGTRRQVGLGSQTSLEPVDLVWSPDGSRVAVTTYTSDERLAGTLYLVSRDGSPSVMVADAWDPIWSPDSRYLAFLSGDGGGPHIDVANADGSGRRPLTDDTVHPDGQIAWLPKP